MFRNFLKQFSLIVALLIPTTASHSATASELFAVLLQTKAAGDSVEKYGWPIDAHTAQKQLKEFSGLLTLDEQSLIIRWIQKLLKPSIATHGSYDEVTESGARITMTMNTTPMIDRHLTLRRFHFKLTVSKNGVIKTGEKDEIVVLNYANEWQFAEDAP